MNCDDANPCTADSCSEGACSHSNLDGTSCGNGSCSGGVCVQPVSASGSDAGAQGTTGLAVFGQNLNLVAGFVLAYLVVAAYFFLKVRKKQ